MGIKKKIGMELIKKIHRTWFVLFIMIFFLIRIKQKRLYNKKKGRS